MSSVYLRPLELADALTSYQWRNNPKIWRSTGSKPNQFITPEMEMEWLKGVLAREHEKRFAICLRSDHKYIGNVFLTDITATDAQIHIFIGDMEYWGGGRAYEALRQIIDYGFIGLQLQNIYNQIKKNNLASLIASKRLGFVFVEELKDDLLKHIFTREMFEKGIHKTYTHKSEA
jgi:RimJ/RimL family protein N-acetyltransferase